MYESPIELNFMNDRIDALIKEVARQQEQNIYSAVHRIGIHVDQDELIRALQYDRNQYDKGYKDGARELADQLKRALLVFDIELHIIDTILKDMGVS